MRRPNQGWRMPSRVMDAGPELQAMLDQVANSSPDPAPDTPVVMNLGPGIWRTSRTLVLKCAAGKNNRTIRIQGSATGATIIAPKDNGPRDCAPNTNPNGSATSELLSINVTSAGGPPMSYVSDAQGIGYRPGGVPYKIRQSVGQGTTSVVLAPSDFTNASIPPPASPPSGYYLIVGAEFVRGPNSGLTSFGYASGELVFLQAGTILPNGDRQMSVQPIPGVRPYPASFDPYQSWPR